ncbi:MAG: ABC transporter permease [Myxococcota bacterium]
MRFAEVLRTAWRSLTSHRLRTALTALGMIIGVAAVMAVLSMGEGAKASVESRIRSLGSNLMTVRPARGRGPVRGDRVQTLSVEDAEAIRSLYGVAAVSAERAGTARVKYREANLSTSVMGVSPSYLAIRSLDVAQGIGFSEDDDRARNRVTVIGATVARELFGNAPALGRRLQVAGHRLTVIGVLEAKGDVGFSSPDDYVLVPLAVHQGVLFGSGHVSSISVQVEREDLSGEVQARLEDLLRLRHALPPGVEDDFEIFSQAEMLQTMSVVTATLTMLLGGVAAVSLLVGGIGIMNIMLVSVRERTREIGVRMAVGARRRDILRQFLVEAVVVSSFGGLCGLGFGVLIAAVLARLGDWPLRIPGYGYILALGVSVTIGLVFGVGPARHAARLDPVTALHQE